MVNPESATLQRVDSDKVTGLWAPALTPLDDRLMPDAGRYVAHVRRLLAGGCHGAALFGTTGEATSFSVEERITVLEAVAAAGLPLDRLMVGTGCCALSDSIRLTVHAAELGCKQVLMLPPFYYKGVGDEGLYASYATVIDRVGDPELALYLYHFPKLSGVPITTGLVRRLLQGYPDTLKGIKDSSGDAAGCAEFIRRFPGLAVFPGTETLMLDMLLEGGAGCISASANVNAGPIREVFDAWRGGRAEARDLQARITAVRQVLQASPMIPTLKHILAKDSGDYAWLRLRPPLMPLSGDQASALEVGLKGLGFSPDLG